VEDGSDDLAAAIFGASPNIRDAKVIFFVGLAAPLAFRSAQLKHIGINRRNT